MDKPLPDPRDRFRRDRDKSLADAGIETLNAIDLMDSPVAALAVAVAWRALHASDRGHRLAAPGAVSPARRRGA